MANIINIIEDVVTMDTTNTDAFYSASKTAKKSGSREAVGFAVITRYESGNCCRVWCAYSNGIWTNCVDCDCLDTVMKDDFVAYIRNRAEQADLNLGYDAE